MNILEMFKHIIKTNYYVNEYAMMTAPDWSGYIDSNNGGITK